MRRLLRERTGRWVVQCLKNLDIGDMLRNLSEKKTGDDCRDDCRDDVFKSDIHTVCMDERPRLNSSPRRAVCSRGTVTVTEATCIDLVWAGFFR